MIAQKLTSCINYYGNMLGASPRMRHPVRHKLSKGSITCRNTISQEGSAAAMLSSALVIWRWLENISPPLKLRKAMGGRSQVAGSAFGADSPGREEEKPSARRGVRPACQLSSSAAANRQRFVVIEWNNILYGDFKYFSFRDKLGFN